MFHIAVLITHLTNFIINKFHLGTGYTWPGYIVLKLFPNILSSKKITFPKGVVLISGTNGKTTTSNLISHVLQKVGLKVTHNKTGSNLEHSIVASILLDISLLGKITSDVGVFEVDEFALPLVLKKLRPNIVALLNLSRDQLDRYWEIDVILDKWKKAIVELGKASYLVLDADQKYFKDLVASFLGTCLWFDSNDQFLKKTALYGEFNARNVNASILICELLGLSRDTVVAHLETFEAAYGRGEAVNIEGKGFQLFLAKNPASFNHNLDIITKDVMEYDTLLFVLNDNIPDGRDVSWIYDIDPPKLIRACENKKICITGTRGLDMAVRLRYAGQEVSNKEVFFDMRQAVSSLKSNPQVANVLVLPNYSAMLAIRKILVGRRIL